MYHRAVEIDELEDHAFESAETRAGSLDGSLEDSKFMLMMNLNQSGFNPDRPGEGTSLPGRATQALLRKNQEYLISEATQGGNKEVTPYSSSDGDAISYCLARVRLHLLERQTRIRIRARGASCSIFRIPPTLCGINPKAEQPEIVSIGPYHRGKENLLELEEHKWFFLEKFLHGIKWNLKGFLEELVGMENLARDCYSETVLMSSGDFLEMLLLDSCFVVQLLRHLARNEDAIDDDDPIFAQPWLIPILIRDLLKLENQLPFFVLEAVFRFSQESGERKLNYLSILALKVFDMAFPRSPEVFEQFSSLRGDHLLHLFHLSLLPSNMGIHVLSEKYRPSNQSIQCVTQLIPSGIKFKSGNGHSFLDINFRNQVLEIPSFTVNDFTSTLLINCVALEQCQEDGSKYFTDYISFMKCLINQPKDVSLLCSNGIITRISQDDLYVANLFNELGKNIVFNVHNCYLSNQFRDVESYYSSNWATMMRTYFCSPWSFISVFSAFVLIVLTMVQTVVAVLTIIGYGYH